jgi:membrane protein DedA with SNARE-associated domain
MKESVAAFLAGLFIAGFIGSSISYAVGVSDGKYVYSRMERACAQEHDVFNCEIIAVSKSEGN